MYVRENEERALWSVDVRDWMSRSDALPDDDFSHRRLALVSVLDFNLRVRWKEPALCCHLAEHRWNRRTAWRGAAPEVSLATSWTSSHSSPRVTLSTTTVVRWIRRRRDFFSCAKYPVHLTIVLEQELNEFMIASLIDDLPVSSLPDASPCQLFCFAAVLAKRVST